MVRDTFSTERLVLALALTCTVAPRAVAQAPQTGRGAAPLATLAVHAVVPRPASVSPGTGAPFAITASTSIVVPSGGGDAARIGEMLARLLRPSTGFAIPVSATGGSAARGAIVLRLGGPADMGDEGYELTIAADSVRLVAARPAGLFRGMQTLRQLLPARIEAKQSLIGGEVRTWPIPPGRITDRPRFAWRGGMLDVSRHFFTVDEVKQYIDLLALYKLNVFHIHLTDDQGWRIQIDSWPKLTTVGGSTEVGGGPGGFYTKADYAEIVRYAADRFITVVPEIDMPAHTQSAIAAYPELGCSRPLPAPNPNAPPGLYTGVRVGFSALCHDKEVVHRFVDDVVRELAAMTPGPYIHLGGDEVEVLNQEQYNAFVGRMQETVARHGKTMIGWDEIGRAPLRPGTIAQMWRPDTSVAAIRQGARVIMSPAPKAYLDMKYSQATEIGHTWAALIELRTAYDWDPVTHFPRVTERDVLGLEAPLWTETVVNISAAQYLLLPRLPAIAEVGWTAAAGKSWESFRTRIAAHAPRWRFLGMNYYPSPQVAWWTGT
jgi:hexosaminidase